MTWLYNEYHYDTHKLTLFHEGLNMFLFVKKIGLKEQSEIFLTFVFFIKRLILVPIDMPEIDFELCRIFAEFFIFEMYKN